MLQEKLNTWSRVFEIVKQRITSKNNILKEDDDVDNNLLIGFIKT